jgi:hypothetical protein
MKGLTYEIRQFEKLPFITIQDDCNIYFWCFCIPETMRDEEIGGEGKD